MWQQDNQNFSISEVEATGAIIKISVEVNTTCLCEESEPFNISHLFKINQYYKSYKGTMP